MSWEQLLAISEANRRAREDARSRPPVICPHDGVPLESGPNGELHCRFDGWVWDGSEVTR